MDAASKAKGSPAFLAAKASLKPTSKMTLVSVKPEAPKVVPFSQAQLRKTGIRRSSLAASGQKPNVVASIPENNSQGNSGSFGSYETKLQQSFSKTLGNSPYQKAVNPVPSKPLPVYQSPGGDNTYAYADLLIPKCPEGVDPARKEEYLSDTEFQKVFGKTKEEFLKLPAWKRVREKQAKKIF